jgi:nicotinamidase-related amidase
VVPGSVQLTYRFDQKGSSVTAVLLLVDAQKNMLLPPEAVPSAEKVALRLKELLDLARSAGVQVVHIRNNGGEGDPDQPGTPGWELVFDVRPDESVIDKHEPDAFAGTNLADLLPPSAPLIIAGMQSEYCIRATSLAALDRGHPVILVRGAHATYDGNLTAQQTSARVEAELSAAGVTLADPQDVRL